MQIAITFWPSNSLTTNTLKVFLLFPHRLWASMACPIMAMPLLTPPYSSEVHETPPSTSQCWIVLFTSDHSSLALYHCFLDRLEKCRNYYYVFVATAKQTPDRSAVVGRARSHSVAWNPWPIVHLGGGPLRSLQENRRVGTFILLILLLSAFFFNSWRTTLAGNFIHSPSVNSLNKIVRSKKRINCSHRWDPFE